MCSKCSICGISLDGGQPQMNGRCVDCMADKWAEIIDITPIINPFRVNTECFEVEYDDDNNDFILIVDGIGRKIGSCTTVMELYDIAMSMRTDKS